MGLSAFETSVLGKFVELFGERYPDLEKQIAIATLIKRENTGSGFFTDLAIDREVVAPVSCTSPLDGPTVRFNGMTEGVDHLLFLKDGYIYLLEGYAVAGEDTSRIDFDTLSVQPMTLRYPVDSYARD